MKKLLKSGIFLILLGICLLSAGSVSAAVFEVTNTNDSGGGSFRAAISGAEVSPESNTIIFSPGLKTGTIFLLTELPDLPNNLTIDGTYAPLIDGSSVGGSPHNNYDDYVCFYIQNKNNITISGLRITGFRYVIDLWNEFSDITIEGCTLTSVHADGEWSTGIKAHPRNGGVSQNLAFINNTIENGGIAVHPLGPSTVQGLTISGNTCTDASIEINLANTADFIAVVDNVMISDNVLDGRGVMLHANHEGTSTSSNSTISNVYIKGNAVNGDSIQAEMVGGTNNHISGLQIKDNRITRDDGEGIHLVNDADPASNSIDTIIENNMIVNCGAEGIQIQGGIQANIVNNFVAGNREGIAFYNGPTIFAVNNLVTKNIHGVVMNIGPDDSSTENIQLYNNMIVGNCVTGIGPDSPLDPRPLLSFLAYNNVWGNGTDYSHITPGASDIAVDPDFVNADAGDYHLSDGSPCIDAGYPDLAYGDSYAGKGGPRADIGLYGGPGGVELVFPTPAVEFQPGILYAELDNNRLSSELATKWGASHVLHLMVGTSPCTVDWVKAFSPYNVEYVLLNDGTNGDFWANDNQFERTEFLQSPPPMGTWRFQVRTLQGQIFEETVFLDFNGLEAPVLSAPINGQPVPLDFPVYLSWDHATGTFDFYRVLIYDGEPERYSIENMVHFDEVDSTTQYIEIPAGNLLPGKEYYWIVTPVSDQEAGIADYVREAMQMDYFTTPPVVMADFTAVPASGGSPLTVHFSDNSHGPVETWSWDFDDGSATSPDPNPVHTFAAPGQYQVELTVTTSEAGGSTDSVQKVIDVHDMVAEITNPPDSLTNNTDYTLFVGGQDVVVYRYRLDEGNWSDPSFTDAPITFSVQSEGVHTLEVIGRDQAATWQSMSAPTQLNWTVDTMGPDVSIAVPDNNTTYDVDQISTIEATATDTNGIDHVDFQVTDGIYYLTYPSGQSASDVWMPGGFLSGNTWWIDSSNFSWTPGKNYTIKARAFDNAGNMSIRSILVIVHDIASNPAGTDLSLILSSQSINLGDSVDVSGQLTPLPVGGGSVDSQTIQIVVKDVNQNFVNQTPATTNTQGGYSIAGLNLFPQPGLYYLNASFAGTASLYPSESSSKALVVGEHPGYAIIVQGRITADPEGLEAYNKTLTRIYSRLLDRGLAESDIYYFNYAFTQGNSDGLDALPDKAQIRWAIETWAANKINEFAAPLYLIMIDHGNRNAFYVDDQVTLSPTDLYTWMNTLEGRLDADALSQKRCVIIGACYSGTFVPVLSKGGRVIVTSAAADEESFKSTLEPDGIRSGEFFMEEFFHDLWLGRSFRVAFKNATARTERYTRQGDGSTNSPNLYFDTAIQHPLLDDNGDQIGSNVLSVGYGDGGVAKDLFLGVGTSQPNGPVDIAGVTDTVYLQHDESSATLWAQANNIGESWMEVRPPSQVLNNVGGTGQLVSPTERHDMTYGTSRYENGGIAFDQSGKYEVFYFHYEGDSNANQISSMQRSLVYKDKEGNNPPGTFSLVSPANSSEQKTMLVFDWENAVDLDPGNDVTYTLIIADGPDIENNVVFKREEIPISFAFVDLSAGLQDAATYYWKIDAVDQYGAMTPSSEEWSFTTNNTNAFPCYVTGTVYNVLNTEPLVGARITASLGGAYADSLENGFYLMIVPAGIANLSGSMAGFENTTLSGVRIPEGDVIEVNIGLLPSGAVADSQAPVSSASMPEGSYDEGQSIALTCVDPGGAGCGAIYYTIDGSEPTSGANVYTEPIMICSDTTLKFYAKDAAGNTEDVHTLVYNVTAGQSQGSVDGDCLVELSDAVLAMQVLTGIDPADTVSIQADVNSDDAIGLDEIVYILQTLSGLRN